MGGSKARAVYEKAKADACDAQDTAKAVSLMTKTVAKAVFEKAKADADAVSDKADAAAWLFMQGLRLRLGLFITMRKRTKASKPAFVGF